jgi:hypothetical protein
MLRRIFAMLLLTSYLYDLGGYMGLRQYLVYQSDRFYDEQTQKGLYNIFDVSEIKVPFHSPGITDWKDYKQISGSVRFQRAAYNYVAILKTRDTLHLLCVPNYQTTRLATHNVISIPYLKDVPVPKKEHVPQIDTLLTHSFIFAFHYNAISPPVIGFIKNSTAYNDMLIHRHIDIPKQPPKNNC